MSHAKSLRVIGQTLQAAPVTTFKLEKHAGAYWLSIAKRLYCFGPADISRLDARAQKNEKTILPDRQTHCCLNSYVLWAVILTESRSALFVSCGPEVLLFSTTNESTENGTIEFLQLKNCGSWVYTAVCCGLAVTLYRSWTPDL